MQNEKNIAEVQYYLKEGNEGSSISALDLCANLVQLVSWGNTAGEFQ